VLGLDEIIPAFRTKTNLQRIIKLYNIYYIDALNKYTRFSSVEVEVSTKLDVSNLTM
jgi:hypothetical protein